MSQRNALDLLVRPWSGGGGATWAAIPQVGAEVAVAAVDALVAGVAPSTVVSRWIDGALRDGPCLLDATWVALDDALRAAAEVAHGRSATAVAIALGLASDAVVCAGAGRVATPLSASAPSTRGNPLDGGGDAHGAAAEVLARCAGGASASSIEAELVAALYADAPRLGHLAPIAAAVASLRASCDAALGPALLASLAATMAEAAGRAEAPAWRGHRERVAPIVAAAAAIAAAQDEAKAAAFQEPKFRAHLVDGDAATGERALAKALAFGVPRALVCGSLALAAAERLLRFDPTIDGQPGRAAQWGDVVWLLRVVEATRRLEVRHPDPGWLGLALYAVAAIHAGAAFDLPLAQRSALPEPAVLPPSWDHGPEVARVVAACQRGDVVAATSALRAYLLMALPEAPLGAAVLEAAFEDPRAGSVANHVCAIGVASAGVEAALALGGHPHRERVWAAVLRVLASARRDDGLAALVRWRAAPPGADVSAVWPWCLH